MGVYRSCGADALVRSGPLAGPGAREVRSPALNCNSLPSTEPHLGIYSELTPLRPYAPVLLAASINKESLARTISIHNPGLEQAIGVPVGHEQDLLSVR